MGVGFFENYKLEVKAIQIKFQLLNILKKEVAVVLQEV